MCLLKKRAGGEYGTRDPADEQQNFRSTDGRPRAGLGVRRSLYAHNQSADGSYCAVLFGVSRMWVLHTSEVCCLSRSDFILRNAKTIGNLGLGLELVYGYFQLTLRRWKRICLDGNK